MPDPIWLRIPLPGDIVGVTIGLPARHLTPEQWDYLGDVLDAMRPGIVAEPAAATQSFDAHESAEVIDAAIAWRDGMTGSRHVWDDCPEGRLWDAVDALRATEEAGR